MPIEPFRISDLTFDNGARLGLCRLPGRSGDLAGDIGLIRLWAPAIVVSMTETAEMAEKGAGELIAALSHPAMARQPIPHAHFPIRDFGAPESLDARWPALARRLHAILDGGGAVLLHCLGGKGRSGMVAMRLMTERGIPAPEALATVRSIRPGAVETPAQEAWATARPLSETKAP